jgi:integrase
MKIDELNKDGSIIEWLTIFETRNASENTISNYLLGMQFYTDCLQKTPTELIEEARAEYRAGLLSDETKINSYLIKFLKYLKEKKLAPLTIRTYFNGIKSFYIYNEIEIPPLVNMIDELKKDEYIIEWLDAFTARNASENTVSNYLFGMQFYTDCLQKTPTELIEEARAEYRAGLLPGERKVKKYLIKFLKYLQEKKLASMTIRGYFNGVKNFYNYHDIEIPPSVKRSVAKSVTLEENKPIPSKEDLQEVLKVCDPLERAILLVGVSSGLSGEDIVNLKVKNFLKGYDQKTEITTLPLRRIKTKVDFITFLSPESSRAIQDYINYRQRSLKIGGDRRKSTIDKQKVYSNDDYLFIGRSIPNSFLITRDDNERKLEERGLVELYRKLSEKAQKSTKKGSWNLIRSHKMRSYFSSTLKGKGCDFFHVEFWLGHKLDNTKSAYFLGNPEERDIYEKYVPYLTIQKEEDIAVNPIFLKEVSYRHAIETELARTSIERSELQELKEKAEKENFALTRVIEDTAQETKTARVEVRDIREQLEKANVEKAEMEARLKVEMKSQVEMVKVEVLSQLSFPALLKTLSDPNSEHYDPQRALKMTSGNVEMIKQVAKIDEKYLYEMKRKKR